MRRLVLCSALLAAVALNCVLVDPFLAGGGGADMCREVSAELELVALLE